MSVIISKLSRTCGKSIRFWPWELNNRWINNPQNKKNTWKPSGKADCTTCLLDRFVCSAGKCRGGKYQRIETHLRVVGTRLVTRPIATHMLTRMCHGSIVKNRWSNDRPIKENTCKMSMSVVHLLLIKTFGTAMSARMCTWLEYA